MPDYYQTQVLDATQQVHEVTLRGKIYADVTPPMQKALEKLADEGLKTLVVNATELEQIDSSGLNAFIHVLKRIRPDGGKITWFGLNGNIARVFEITKLRKVMGVVGTRAEALA